MLIWIDKVFSAYLVANPPPEGVQPVLLLDLYRCHMMALVVSRIEAMGVHVTHIAGGCTGLTQPLDVGINRSFKARCRRMWEEWFTNLIDMTNEVRDATREEVSEWAAAVFRELVGLRILRNSWRKTGFDWFLGVVDLDDIADGGEGGDDGHDDGNMVTMVGRTTDTRLTTHCWAATTRRGRRAGTTKTARTRVTTTNEERGYMAGVGCMLHNKLNLINNELI